jgi:MoxR-like ATPase
MLDEKQILDIKKINEILNIENTTERCARVLNEVQPVLDELVQGFLYKYIPEDGILPECELRTYESTLRTTYSDSINPRYSEAIKETTIGTKDFSKLIKRFDNDVEVNLLSLAVYGKSKTLRIGIETEFYYFWQVMRENALGAIIDNLNEEIKICLIETPFKEISRDKLSETIQTIIKSNKKPSIFVGFEIPFEDISSETNVVGLLWKAWQDLKELRAFNMSNGYKQGKTLSIVNLLKTETENLNINLYGHSYEIRFSEIEKFKSRSGHYHNYFVEENGQLVAKGFISYYKYNNNYCPIEVLAVNVNGTDQINTSPRALLGDSITEWFVKKSFTKRSLDNAKLQRDAIEALKLHNFKVNNFSYYIASFDNSSFQFKESIKEIKENILKAALIFADVSEVISLSKEAMEGQNTIIDEVIHDSEETNSNDSNFVSNFDLLGIIKLIEDSKFTFSREIIKDFHLNLTALGDKHFVILNGISGTGKTQICRLYANAVYGLNYEEQNPYLKVIPVRPDWTDSTALLGYYSAIQKKYVMTEFLETVLNAMKEPGKPHFIVLDEMNLARVEYYLSDYLSAVESRKPIRLHSESEVNDIPKEITIPRNIYIIGTVNVDETTHSISDKVLDRAFVMTLSDVDLEVYWNSKETEIRNSLTEEFDLLLLLHNTLRSYELHFGYRSMDEMISKLYANINLPEELQSHRRKALDRVICEKVLPKIRGDERIVNLLSELLLFATEYFSNASEMFKHVSRMKGELERYGATQFWR